jgi:Kef-type K+ transport system membrane component KefB
MIMLGMVNDLATLGTFDLADIALANSVAAGFTVVVIFFGIWAVSRYHARLRMLPLPHPMLNIAIALTLGLAVVANLIGLAAIIGAFFAGLIFAEQAERYRLTNAIAPIYQFLVPFFFVVIGTRLNPALIVNGGLFVDIIIITSVAIVAKLVGAGIGAAGLSLRLVAIIGTGMVLRGEVGLIVASLGLTQGIITPELFSVVVIMSIVTTLIVPPVLTWLIRLKARGPAPTRGRPTQTSARPSGK